MIINAEFVVATDKQDIAAPLGATQPVVDIIASNVVGNGDGCRRVFTRVDTIVIHGGCGVGLVPDEG